MKRLILLVATAAATMPAIRADINSPAPAGYIERSVDMYCDDNFRGTIDQLATPDASSLTPDQTEKVRYYRAVATVHTDKPGAVALLQTFLADYPSSQYRDAAMMAYGDCFYGSDYARALKIYADVNADALTPALRDDLWYRMAYSNLKLERFDRAQSLLSRLTDSPVYADAARFFRGFIAYRKGDYSSAETILRDVNTSKAPGNMADYYLSEIYYSRADYTNALRMARNMLDRKDVGNEFRAEAYRIAGESSYARGDDAQAVKYLETYNMMVQAPMPSALYILGLNAYNQGDYRLALEYLKPVTEKADAMGQSAYLYMGQAYMHQRQYSDAAMAFNRALNMHYDPAVQETAYYNYAVASMQGGKVPFANTVEIFSNFLKLYPDSRYAADVQQYIVNSYLTDNNYAAALKSINEMKNPSQATLAAKQRVLYALGTKALGASNYPQALKYLQEARSLGKHSADIDREVSLALGEALYQSGDYARAESEILAYLKGKDNNADNRALAYYDLGYTRYAQHKYAQAADDFERMIKAPGNLSSILVADAWNRLGDCYYYRTDFTRAASAYDKAYSVNPSAGDYALFQKALMLGYQRQYTQKIDMLRQMRDKFPSSALIPDALLETTECYIQLGNNGKAIEIYRELVSQYPNTAQGRQGYLQMALVMLNNGDHDGAVDAYKQVIRRYPTSEEARQAVEQMKRIAAADGTLKDFMAFLNNTKGAPQMDESEIEQLTFENAEKLYFTAGKVDKLEEFVEDYPDSNMRARALAYLVDGEMAIGDQQAAYEYAEALIAQYPDYTLTPNAMHTKAMIEENRGQGNLAMRTWQQLAQVASTPEMLLDARMGIIRNAREAGDYDLVLTTADAVLASSGIGPDEQAEAVFSRGLALYRRGDVREARSTWETVAHNSNNPYGVMSAYYLAESFFNNKDYNTAKKWAEVVTDADADYQYWIARGFILLSDIYAAQGDKYKARQYLEAVRDYYGGSEADIFDMINQRLK